MNSMLDSLNLENIANVKIKAYKNTNIYNDIQTNGENQEDDYYDVYILTYIKHIVRIKANLALHGGLYSNYFEKYEEESISNIMLNNLLSKDDKKTAKETANKSNSNPDQAKNDLNYNIKELLNKLIKSYKIRENKIFLITGMLGCGKTTCVNLAIEYFNKFLQIEKNIKDKNEIKKSVLFITDQENSWDKKIYKKTPYTAKNYQQDYSTSYETSSSLSSPKKIKINFDEPLFNFTPKKKKNTRNESPLPNKQQILKNAKLKQDSSHNNGTNLVNENIEQINDNIKNLFENNDLSPLRKNTNIRNKIQFEELFKEHTKDDKNENSTGEDTHSNRNSDEDEWNSNECEHDDDENDSGFNRKYRKIVDEIIKEEKEERFIYIIRISAYLYKDDLQCIKSIYSQLYNYIETDDKMPTNLLLNDYIIKLEQLLVKINDQKKQTILIIENVEKFCLQNKQNLLYTLFDLLHKKSICINIICLTNVLDITQTLEKRIKSRFTFEMIYISPILNIEEITKLVYKVLYVNLDDFHLIKKYYSVYFSYSDLIKIQKFLQIYNSTIQKEIANNKLLNQWSYDISYGLDIRHIYHTCVDAILSICEYKHILNGDLNVFENNTILDPTPLKKMLPYNSQYNNSGNNYFTQCQDNNENISYHEQSNDNTKFENINSENFGLFAKDKKSNLEYLKERPCKLDCTPIKRNFNDDEKFNENERQILNDNIDNQDNQFHFNMDLDMSPRKLKENIKLKNNVESYYILNNVQSKFIRRHYIKKVLRDLCSIEYMILCAFTRLYKKEILPKTLYVIILEINKFKQAYPQEQIVGFSLDAYRRSFFRLVDLDIIILSSYSLNHLNIKNFSNDSFGLHEPTKFPCYDIFLENIETYNLNHNLIQWVKQTTEVMQ
ncbi:conserved Plasmodium protein, unknown function [Plasmodium vinckei brucechwatti]|uniref:Origin recognition complex subunit 1 n=1 Tax=Plasmodium vinckei brucechwatti TaxID=119398 RepID=A0A6V7STD8_PLAVN|nr:conserved Plasmodium protein, unknown function [Plasmodium vinckei brucechwatti]